MKKKVCRLLLVLMILPGIGVPGQPEEEVLQESVRVVNIEVPVRVYYQGKPVDNLTKNDFKLYERGKRQDIHGFILKRKKIKVQDLGLNVDKEKILPKRYFILVFRITHYNEDIKKGLDFLFDTILTENDQLLVFANDRSDYFKFLNNKLSVKSEVDKILQESSLEARNKMFSYMKSVEKEVEKHKFQALLLNLAQAQADIHMKILRYLEKFLEIWKNYKTKFLIPDINKFLNFAQFLRQINQEKWVINFYQFELFPDIIINSDSMNKIRNLIGQWQAGDASDLVLISRLISRLLNEIEKELSVAKDFPSDEVAKIFQNVDATFHSIFMKTTFSALLQDAEYREIASDLENSLRAITKRTGGELIVSNKLDTALDRISEIEDIYYILTYAPRNPDKVGKVKVKLKSRKYKLVYSPNLKSGYLGQIINDRKSKEKEVKIENLQFNTGTLMFGISDFYWDEEDGGMLQIHIQIKDHQGNSVFNQKKLIKATQKNIHININLKTENLKDGTYQMLVDVCDLYTTHKNTQLLNATISR